MMKTRLLLGGTAIATAWLAGSVSAQTRTQADAWLAWHGCWQAQAAPLGESLCIVPDGAGVRMITVHGSEVIGEARVVTDGQARQVEQDGCRGTERALFAVDRQRVFLRSDLSCENDVTRRANGIFSFVSPSQWISVQAITVDDRTATRTVRYSSVDPRDLPAAVTSALRNSDPYARMAARRAALAAIDERDVTEAVNSVDAVATEEWLSETGSPFSLNEDRTTGDVVVSGSALALTSRGGAATIVEYDDRPREVVHVVERPVYVTHHVHHVVRSCWDPFFSGWVSLGGHVRVGVNYSSGFCGRHRYGWYSPWGYDLFGWHWVPRPIVIVRGGPVIIHRRNYGHRGDRYYNDRDRYDRGDTRYTNRNNNDDRTDRDMSSPNWVPAPPSPSKNLTTENWAPPAQGPSRVAKSAASWAPPAQGPSRVVKTSEKWPPPAQTPRVNKSGSAYTPPAPRASKSSYSTPSSYSAPRVSKPSGGSYAPSRSSKPSQVSAPQRVSKPSGGSAPSRISVSKSPKSK